MTQLGINLPDSFFEEEVRSGYTVRKEMKKIWAVELDLMDRFLRACKKYDLKCYADAGTLLGAVRHRGFIPWDDDIDLVMFREDYDKMVALADREFEKPYFFQNAYSDEGYCRGHAQFRNSDTTGILGDEKDMCCKYNLGIFIDIFVLDGVVNNQLLLEVQKWKVFLEKGLMYHCLFGEGKRNNWKHRLCKVAVQIGWKGENRAIFKLMEDDLRRYPVDKCRLVAPLGFAFETKKRVRDKHLYDQEIWLDFEMMKIPAPAGYHEFLSARYGDYMKPVKVPTTHGEVFFDVDRPYDYYMEREAER